MSRHERPLPAQAAPELHQVAALPVRAGAEGLEVCLITTRETGRWTIPKGWPMKGRRDRRAAAIEAEQEAGLKGRIGREPLGSFLYFKRRDNHFDLVRVEVYRLDVTDTLDSWRECHQRVVRWLPPAAAAALVQESGLSALLAALA